MEAEKAHGIMTGKGIIFAEDTGKHKLDNGSWIMRCNGQAVHLFRKESPKPYFGLGHDIIKLAHSMSSSHGSIEQLFLDLLAVAPAILPGAQSGLLFELA